MSQKTTLVGGCARIPPSQFAGTAVANAAVFTGHPTLESDAYQAHAVLSIGKIGLGGNL